MVAANSQVIATPSDAAGRSDMAKPLAGGIAKSINKAIGAANLYLPATLIKVVNGNRTPGSLSAGANPTETPYTARGFIEHYSTFAIVNSLATGSDRKISLLGASIAGGQIPTSGDKITIEGVTYRVTNIDDRDPAAAMYVCKCRI